MKKAMIIVNPSSGREEAVNYIDRIEEILKEKSYDVIVSMTEKELDATRFCQDACKQEFDLVVSLGGDGTLNETINGMVDQEHRPVLAIIPLGTVNDFARALQIPLDPEEAVEFLRSDRTKSVDIGKFNDRYFVNIVAVGSVAEATYEVTPEQKTKFGPLAYVMEGFKTLKAKRSYPLRIEYEDKAWEGDSFLFLAALTNSTGGIKSLAPEAEVNDGHVHCYVIKDVSMLRLASIVSSILQGNLKNEDQVEYFATKNLHISSPDQLTTNVDGEEGDPLPAAIEVKPAHIQVIVK
ncbi:diacylglycerol/lipid kinase family protein [Halobacillus yeomjeoni]|uniref:Diacylglycerol kinase family lipid kinase n=1 Tax=Halobacillus yeomjeoni TaxID=311194 RepID=A0A931HXE2_9BACI|nr:diacylglycerol kinase family protein [Halobacillus yeomjeoni]MBH0231607.1 diacylglycerol kinase family lipid kinase [Halobacillus yeomjeoni]